MAYLVTGGGSPGSIFRTFSVRYTASGGEVTVTVDLPVTMADTSYAVTCSSAGGDQSGGTSSGVQVPDMPVEDRTVDSFEALFGSPLTAGDVFEFTISGNATQ